MGAILEQLRGLFGAKDEAPVRSPPVARKTGLGAAHPICFIVDDEPAVCHFLSAAAAECMAQPESFSSIKRLSAGLSKRTPALVFLDVSLADSDGIDGLRLLAQSEFPGLVALMSGGDMLDEIRLIGEEYSLRMLSPLAKPLDPGAVKNVFDLLRSDDSATTPLAVDLAEALQRSWIEFWYQPKIDLKKMRLAGAELLARVNHPDHGVLAPGTFIPNADPHSLLRLTGLALGEALRAGVEFSEARLPLRLSVNMPISALVQLDVPALVRDYHRGRDGWPGLILEITDDRALDYVGGVREIAIQLRLWGVLLSLDDFGHACLSLSRIKSVPIYELKIGPSFASNCSSDRSNAALCQTIVDLGHRFGCAVCGQGIETADELRALHQMGCDFGQGFLLAAPMPKDRFLESLQRRTGQPSRIAPPQAPGSAGHPASTRSRGSRAH
jgi:EAL domain-containing protein (putative c-di-GMP-specific phosphodiesterase class I)